MRNVQDHPPAPTNTDDGETFNKKQNTMAQFISDDFLDDIEIITDELNIIMTNNDVHDDGSGGNMLEASPEGAALIPSGEFSYDTFQHLVGELRFNETTKTMEYLRDSQSWVYIGGEDKVTTNMMDRIKNDMTYHFPLTSHDDNLVVDNTVHLFFKAYGSTSSYVTENGKIFSRTDRFSPYGKFLSGASQNLMENSTRIGPRMLDFLPSAPNQHYFQIRDRSHTVWNGLTEASSVNGINIYPNQPSVGIVVNNASQLKTNDDCNVIMSPTPIPSVTAFGIETPSGEGGQMYGDSFYISKTVPSATKALTFSLDVTYGDDSQECIICDFSDTYEKVGGSGANKNTLRSFNHMTLALVGCGTLRLTHTNISGTLSSTYRDIHIQKYETFKLTLRVSAIANKAGKYRSDIFVNGELVIRDSTHSTPFNMGLGMFRYLAFATQTKNNLDSMKVGSVSDLGIHIRNVRCWSFALSNSEIRIC